MSFLIGTILNVVTSFYHLLIKHKYKKPKLRKEFDLKDSYIVEAFLLPIRVSNEPYLRSFQYKVLNSILFTNDTSFIFQSLSVTFVKIPQKLGTIYCLVVRLYTLFGWTLLRTF